MAFLTGVTFNPLFFPVSPLPPQYSTYMFKKKKQNKTVKHPKPKQETGSYRGLVMGDFFQCQYQDYDNIMSRLSYLRQKAPHSNIKHLKNILMHLF